MFIRFSNFYFDNIYIKYKLKSKWTDHTVDQTLEETLLELTANMIKAAFSLEQELKTCSHKAMSGK
jgi:hypothetical protein